MCRIKLIFIIGLIIFLSSAFINAGRVEKIRENIEKTTALLNEEKALHQKEKKQAAQAQKSLEDRIKVLEEKIGKIQKEKSRLKKEIDKTKITKKNLIENKKEVDFYLSNVKNLLCENSQKLRNHINSGFPYEKENRMRKIDGLKKRLEEQDLLESTRELWHYFLKEIDLSYDSEIYSEEVETEKGEIKKAKFLRVGKVILAFQTNDGEKSGRWIEGGWKKDLCRYCRTNIRKAIQIMEGKRIPHFLEFPVRIDNTDYKKNDYSN